MIRFAANISLLFTELPLLDRIAAARDAGFDAVEILFPYDHDPALIRARLQHCGMPLALINTPAPDWQSGGRGSAALPGAEKRFQREFAYALEVAGALGAEKLHVMSGRAGGAAAKERLIANLHWACDAAAGLNLTIEPINTTDMPGYFLDDFDLAADVLDRVKAANLSLQFDAYHAARITGDPVATWARHGHRATHVQIADAPGRHEPGSGHIDFASFFARLEATGYRGYVSAEYHPADTTTRGLGWLRR
ncbi:hydroxypyruvate isomerase family protein [Shimia sp.]|uniref:hydroxypyruvate isomerase family protein n=1 Tax=Shimia sp. TaxID=1954381 RepID=UPI003566F575